LDLRTEEKRIRSSTIVKWLDAQPVARDEERLFFAVPDGECEHAPKVVNAFASMLFVEVNNRFCIRIGPVSVAALLESLTQLRMVINFAIEDDPNGPIFVAEGLVSAGDVNNAEPAHPDGGWAVGIYAFIVWAAVRHGGAHAAN